MEHDGEAGPARAGCGLVRWYDQRLMRPEVGTTRLLAGHTQSPRIKSLCLHIPISETDTNSQPSLLGLWVKDGQRPTPEEQSLLVKFFQPKLS